MSGAAGTIAPTHTDTAGERLPADPPAVLDGLGAPDAAPEQDAAPAGRRRKRSGTSGAERARRAKAAGGSTSTGTSSTTSKPRASRSRAKAPNIAQGMTQLYVMAGMGASVVPHPVAGAVGQSLVANAGSIGAAWEDAAKADPRVRDALEKLLTVSTFGAIIAAHLPVVLAGMAAGGALPPALAAQMGLDVPAPRPAPEPAPEPSPSSWGGSTS